MRLSIKLICRENLMMSMFVFLVVDRLVVYFLSKDVIMNWNSNVIFMMCSMERLKI